MGNTDIWDTVQRTDPKYTKEFNRSGGFKGTATNATWLARRATETFGPMGIGWGITVKDESIFDGAPIPDSGTFERVHRVHIVLWYKWNGERGEIEHFGQTMLVGKNKYGPFTDEEAPKKSLTDAMTKALSLLGFASDIHMGLYDDSKYVSAVKEEIRNETQPQKQAPVFDPEGPRKMIRQLPGCTPDDSIEAGKLTTREELLALHTKVSKQPKFEAA